MGLFSAITDVAGGFIAGGRQKRGIDEAVGVETAAAGENIVAGDALRDRGFARTAPFTSTGGEAAQSVFDIVAGNRRLEPTAAETFAQEQALEGIDRGSAATKSLMSGRRLEDLATASAGIGSQFRQQGINNLNTIANRGLNATGMDTNLDVGVTGEQNRLRELIGNIKSGGILGKTQVDVGNIANVSGNLSNLAGGFTGFGGGGGNKPDPLSSAVLGGGIFS